MKRTHRGSTLLETLLSILILAFICGTLMGAFIVSKCAIARATHRTTAIDLLANKIEQLLASSYVSVAVATTSESTMIDERNPSDTMDDLYGTLETVVSNTGGDYKKVQVTLSWPEPGFHGTLILTETIVTYITQE